MTHFLKDALLVGFLVISAAVATAQQPEKLLKITETIGLPYPGDWTEIDRTPNSIDLMKPSAKQKGAVDARIHVTTEIRQDHAEALRRLGEIAVEEKESPQFVVIAGWPALERRRVAPLARTGQEIERKPLAPLEMAVRVTIAVAVGVTLVRLEGTLAPNADEHITEEILGIGHRLAPTSKGDAQKATEELGEVQRSLPKPRLAVHPAREPLPHGGTTPRTPGLKGMPGAAAVQRGVGELEVAVSNNGQTVVVAANSGYSNSTDGGASFTSRGGLAISFPRDGDPSLAFGQSGAFYQSFIGYPNGTAAAGGVTGCSDSLSVSTDNGVTFPFRSHAVVCPNTGSVCFPDQEHIAADPLNPGLSGDQVYFTWRNFTPVGTATSCNFGSGYTAPRIVCSNTGGNSWGVSASVGTGDFPRITTAPDGSVYVVYSAGGNVMLNKFSSCKTGLVVQPGFPVTVAAFTLVPCPIAGLDRCDDGNTLSSPTVAVDDLDASHVYVAYATSTGAGNDNIIVADSADGGLTFPRTATVNTGVAARRFMPWACTVGGVAYVSWYDRRSATATANDLTRYFGGSAAVRGGSLVAGPEADISGVDDPQCATWPCGGPRSANGCTTCPTGTICPTTGNNCPKYGDYNGAACGVGRRYNAWASGVPPTGVTAPGAGINVYENTGLVPSDFFIRDWTVDANHHDLGQEPSTNPDFYTSSDVWNQQSSSTPAPLVNDWVAGEPDANAGGPTGNNNFAFVRVSRRAPAAPSAAAVTVPITFLKADYGLGTNYIVVATSSLAFNASDQAKILSPGTGWRLDAGASGHICLAAEIDVPPFDPLIAPSLNGGAPGPNDSRITQDNNKAQRNLGTVALPGSSGGAAFYAIIHNAQLETRDITLTYLVPPETLKRLSGTRVGIIDGLEQPLQNKGRFVLPKMQPGEFRWLEVAFGKLEGEDGDLLPILVSEVAGGETVVNGFTVGVRPSSRKVAFREALERQQAVLSRFAFEFKEPRAAKAAEEARELFKRAELDEKGALAYLKESTPGVMGLLKPHFESENCPSPFHRAMAKRFAESSRLLLKAVRESDVPALLGAHAAVFNQVDTHLSMIQKAEGDAADALQMMKWQKQLYSTVPQLKRLKVSRLVAQESDEFIRSYSRDHSNYAGYSRILGELVKNFQETARDLEKTGLHLAPLVADVEHNLNSTPGRLEKAHRQYLLKLGAL